MHIKHMNFAAIAAAMLCACVPTAPISEDAERAIQNWSGKLPEDRQSIQSAWPQFECVVNTHEQFNTAQPLQPVAADVRKWGFKRVQADRIRLRAPDLWSAKLTIYQAYTGPDLLLVDQCVGIPNATADALSANYQPLLNQRDAAYYLWSSHPDASKAHKALACQLIDTCGATTNPFEIEDEATRLAPYVDRGLALARERPLVMLTMAAKLSGYDMDKERYWVQVPAQLVPGRDSYKREGDTLIHSMEQGLGDDTVYDSSDVAVLLDPRAEKFRLDLEVPKKAARGIEDDGFGVFAGRAIKVVVYAKVTKVDIQKRQIFVTPIRLVGETINWPSKNVPLFDGSWKTLNPKPMNDVDEMMFEMSVHGNGS